ncbi:hypothetical protein D917_08298 [Trichinella nativa]|uniref:Uncharacterized protein n=1 Tax=Trichinella nativa TaxID=6335 RepID=A0A1Y3ELN8_9BILA|nr:hypothetical protein D917_08298 [Trichinella nativa]
MSSHATNAYRQNRNISHFCCCENRRLNEIFAQLDKNCRNVEINDHAYATHMLLESRVSKTYSSCRSSSE